MKWEVDLGNGVEKKVAKLPQTIRDILSDLITDLETKGPIQPEWPNFSPLNKGKKIAAYHCHLKKGKPTFLLAGG